MKHSFVLVAILALAIAGCDSKKKKCEKVAEHLQALSDQEGGHASQSADYQNCMDYYTDKQIECAMNVKSSMGVVDCMTPK